MEHEGIILTLRHSRCRSDSLWLNTIVCNARFCQIFFFQKSFWKKMKMKSLSCVWLFVTPWTVTCQAPPSMGFSRQEYWSTLHFLLQGIFPTQGSNSGLPHCRKILYQLSHKGSPKILEWVTYPFSSGSSQHRNRTRVSCIAGGFFTNWAIREAHKCPKLII